MNRRLASLLLMVGLCGSTVPALGFDMEDYATTYRATRDAYQKAWCDYERMRPYWDALIPKVVAKGSEVPIRAHLFSFTFGESLNQHPTTPVCCSRNKLSCMLEQKSCNSETVACLMAAGTDEVARQKCQDAGKRCFPEFKACYAAVVAAENAGQTACDPTLVSTNIGNSPVTVRDAVVKLIETGRIPLELAGALMEAVDNYESTKISQAEMNCTGLPTDEQVTEWIDSGAWLSENPWDNYGSRRARFGYEDWGDRILGLYDAYRYRLENLRLATAPYKAARRAYAKAYESYWSNEHCADFMMPIDNRFFPLSAFPPP